MESDTVIGIVVVSLIGIFVLLGVIAVCMPHTPQGYYLQNEEIYLQRPWMPDERACDFTEARWQQILDNNMHVKINVD